MPRDLRRMLSDALHPLRTRVANMVARGVVQVIKDSGGLQVLQLGVQQGEDVDDCERFQEYGFTSRPLEGAEAVAVFPNGDHGRPLVVAVDDRRHRLTGLEPGEVAVYNEAGARIVMKASGDIELEPAGGGEILGGGSSQLATKADIDALENYIAGHAHGGVTSGSAASGPPASPPPPASGTGVLKGS